MNLIDLVLGGIVVLGALQGFRKGLIKEVAAIVALIGGYLVARTFSDLLTPLLRAGLSIPDPWYSWISFFLLFVITVSLITLIGRFLTQLLKWVALGFVNRLAGAVFGASKWVLLLCLGLYFFEYLNQWVVLIHPDQLEASQLYGLFHSMGNFFLDELSQVDLPKKELLEV